MKLSKSDIRRFWSKVVRTEGCWIFTGSLTHNGYGRLSANGHTYRAHRVAYEVSVGAVPDGMCICHKCDNRICVRPDHLFLGTDIDNIQDRNQKGRQCKGSGHHSTKLSEEDVIYIRTVYKPHHPKCGASALARMYGVTHHAVLCVISGRSWSHVQ